MKQTIVPAQITTVEDKIAGSLSLRQLVLLMAPLFLGTIIFAILPPVMTLSAYKVVLAALFAAACGLMAVRVTDKIVLEWAFLILRYNFRARYYVYDKNDSYLRTNAGTYQRNADALPATVSQKLDRGLLLSLEKRMRLESIISSSDARLSIRSSDKGELRLVITKQI